MSIMWTTPVRYRFESNKRHFISPSIHVSFRLFYKYTANEIFDDFRKISDHFPKISEDVAETQPFFFPSQIINCACFLMSSGDKKLKTIQSTMQNIKYPQFQIHFHTFSYYFFNNAISSTREKFDVWHAHELRSFYSSASDGNNVYVDPSKISRT